MHHCRFRILAATLTFGIAVNVAVAQEASPRAQLEKVSIHIEPQPLDKALTALGTQTGLTVIIQPSLGRGLTAPAVNGSFTADEALRKVLAAAGLKAEYLDDKTVAIRRAAAVDKKGETNDSFPRTLNQIGPSEVTYRLSVLSDSNSTDSSVDSSLQSSSNESDETTRKIPEILVRGSRALNADIKRDKDDIQPYVIFEKEAINNSGAQDLQEFLKERLTMNTTATGPVNGGGTFGPVSQINLRGLGTNQTLILVNGRRLPSVSAGGDPNQPDLNGIPISAVERIEVLPTTASGIYGGGATGGVINVILKHDFRGIELRTSYGNAFKSDAATRRVDVSGGIPLENGRTNILIAATWKKDGGLDTGDRDFYEQGIQNILHNNPGFINNAFTPPLGATTNILSVNGSPLFGPGTPSFTSVPVGYAGNGGLAPLEANAGRYNLNLAKSAQQGGGAYYGLTVPSTLKSLTASISRDFSDSITAFLDGGVTRTDSAFPQSGLTNSVLFGTVLSASASNNPFGQDVFVSVPSSSGDVLTTAQYNTYRTSGGVVVHLPRDWSAETDYSWNRATFRQIRGVGGLAADQLVSDGSVDVLRDTSMYPVDLSSLVITTSNSPFRSTTQDASIRLAGPLMTLPGGSPTLTALLEWREDQVGDGTGTNFSDSGPGTPQLPTSILSETKQFVTSGYLELNTPLISNINKLPLIQSLDIQVAVRRDSYRTQSGPGFIVPGTVGAEPETHSKLTSTDPTIGFRWRPSSSVMFRGSYSTGFRPPSVSDLSSPFGPFPGFAGGTLVDPKRGNSAVGVAYQTLLGGNPGLQPEKSKSWSAGIVFTPSRVPGLRVSTDYTRISKNENITTLTGQQIIDNENLFPGRVGRAPVPPGDPYGVGPINFLNVTEINAAKAKLDALDTDVGYELKAAHYGTFQLYGVLTWEPHFSQQVAPDAPNVDSAGVGQLSPLKIKANAGFDWRFRSWGFGWNSQYYDSYIVADPTAPSSVTIFQNQGSQKVPSQIYSNLYLRYIFAMPPLIFSRTEVKLSVSNVFNKKPPFDATQPSFYSPFGDPRLASYQLELVAAF